jgi:hypothetical protein
MSDFVEWNPKHHGHQPLHWTPDMLTSVDGKNFVRQPSWAWIAGSTYYVPSEAVEAPTASAKIITAQEMAEHYEPLLDLCGALLALEEARAEIERLKAEVQELMDELAYHGIYPNDLAALEKQP